MTIVPLRDGAAGFVRFGVARLGGRAVVSVDACRGGDDRGGALASADGRSLTEAARLARTHRLPLVLRLASSGADRKEGIDTLHGWGLAAREMARCSGVVPVIVIASGPNVSGPALMLGLADFVIMTAPASRARRVIASMSCIRPVR